MNQLDFWMENTESNPEDDMFIECRHCSEVKPREEFRLYRRATGDDRDCRSTSCKECQRSNGRLVDMLRKTAPPMSEGCDVCGKKGKLVLDHCYQDKKFRGWLCHHCNLAIGILGDTVEGLNKAIEYLRRGEKKNGTITTAELDE